MTSFYQDSVSDCSNPRHCILLLCIHSRPSIFPNPSHINCTDSSSHMSVPCLCTIISNFNTRSFIHLGVAHLCPRIPITHPDFFSLPFCGRTTCRYPHCSFSPFNIPASMPGWPEVFFQSSLDATTPSSFTTLIRTLCPLYIPRIRDVAPPTAPQLPAVALCKSYSSRFPLPLICLLPPESAISYLLIASLSSP